MRWNTRSFALDILAFVCGAAVMALELAGSRLLAPFVGASIFTWTSLIGIILASLSVGYSVGGRAADKKPSLEHLGYAIVAGALGVSWTLYSQYFLPYPALAALDLRLGAVIASIALFVPATVCLGAVSPYIVKLKAQSIDTVGATVGNVYTFSTIGSICGTFLGGFFLVSYLGTNSIIFSISFVLFLSGAVVLWFSQRKGAYIVLGLIALSSIAFASLGSVPIAPGFKLVADRDTDYGRMWVFDGLEHRTGRPIRYLTNSAELVQSGIYLDTKDLIFDYTKAFDIFASLNPKAKDALLIGAGAYTYPMHFLSTFPDKSIDVVDIDPGLLAIGEEFFFVKKDPRMGTAFEDGRTFLNRNEKKYGAVLIDAFLSYFAIPFQLTTVEAVKRVSDSLTDEGVVVANIIGAMEGEGSLFLQAEYNTYKAIFPYVYLMPLQKQSEGVYNIVLLAFKQKPQSLSLASVKGVLPPSARIVEPAFADDVPILTDSFAPVERYVSKLPH